MLEKDKIVELKNYYVNELYANVRAHQKVDQQYRDDTFAVPEVRDPHRVWRSGTASRMVDAPAEQMVTSNPQAFFEIRKGDRQAAIRFSEEVNQIWIEDLRLQNPNPFKESLKNKLGRGENYIKLVHNEQWVTNKKLRYGMPVLFLIPDPMVIYGSPEEDDCGWLPNCGVPNRVIIFYERQPIDVILRYPSWTNPKKAGLEGDKGAKVQWLEYWDKDIRYFEADGEPVLKGEIQPNPYHFVPFVRKYSGFGRRSPAGELADLIVSDIRFSRDLIKQECITRSNIASIEHIFAHRPKTIIAAEPISQAELDELDWGAYDLNVLTADPNRIKFVEDQYPSVPPEMYANLNNIKAEIAQRNPFIMAGFPFGTSGRQQGMSELAAMRRYDTVLENTEIEWATAIEMALKICQVIPTLKPDGLRKGDLTTTFKCAVKLKAEDKIEEDRLITLGDRLRRQPNPAIDIETFHTQYMGMTQAESKEVIAKILADMVTIYNPDVAMVMGMVAAEETGMARWLEEAQRRRQEMEQMQGLQREAPKTTQERMGGEVETELGREIGTEGTRGGRRPPERYTRGGF